MKEYLDSNRVNFLIWRYLLEGNYRETAVKFQKEWHVQEPHRQLDFAPYVKSHALVNVLNKGLLYHSLEREHAQTTQVPGDAAAQAALAEAMQLGVFGPLVAHPPPRQQQQPDESDDDAEAEPDMDVQPMLSLAPAPTLPAVSSGVEVENSRKRQGDRQQQSLVNGSPAKRPRLSNGYEHGVDAATTPMELDGQDHQGDNHAYPSPLEGEQAQTPVPHTDGPEQGTQVDKVEELASETTFIPLGSGLDDAPALSPVTALPRVNGDSAPVLLHCQWHPRDPSLLAAAGTDALARIWNISRGAAADPASADHVNGVVPDFHTLVEDDIPPKATVTAMSWNWDGSAIAVATDSDSKARLTLWTPEGSYIHHFEVAEPPIIKLRWSPRNTAILAIAPDNRGTLITIYHAHTLNSLTYFLSDHDLNTEPLDAAWTNDTDFLLCGGDLFELLRYTDREISQVQKFETREGDTLTQVQYDPHHSLAATCGEKGVVDVWDSSGKRRSIEGHCDAVTALAWQPMQSPITNNERLLASGGEDGAICIWNAFATDGVQKCSMTMGPAIVALAFTPDGAFIAGATSERILIWKVGDHSIPRASWSRLPHPAWSSPRMNPDSDEEDEHCLGWDSTGHKLAYGVNSRLAVINFR
ncbi:putative nuclear receptor co-repressor HDAC3 complex subunit TBLR1 [Rosellinia necatrix]|uniref:Putative nuclear receptor co-repressor HDAC3 complex subunit TBLR1 n=1 Tax=Rosellinia necatrix TaxID=77044 RepID=A0A1W2TI81_ROSNE|nr:putative nuclear receptor co-repressor HDAC3 complex subunit TBLR1 [Rosellinia necatrix]